MELKKYHKEHSAIICSWIKDKKSLYQWSANRIGRFPLEDNDLNEDYAPMIKSNRFIPLSAFDEKGNLVGHLYIRYPNEDDDSIVRFGFVIVDPVLLTEIFKRSFNGYMYGFIFHMGDGMLWD